MIIIEEREAKKNDMKFVDCQSITPSDSFDSQQQKHLMVRRGFLIAKYLSDSIHIAIAVRRKMLKQYIQFG